MLRSGFNDKHQVLLVTGQNAPKDHDKDLIYPEGRWYGSGDERGEPCRT